jgi:hypothetical protein
MEITSLFRLTVYSSLFASFAHAASPAGKRFGGLAPEQTFTLRVEDRRCFQTKGGTTVQSFRIPPAIPRLNVGQKVKFTVGNKGELKGPGFTLRLEQGYRDYNQYLSAVTRKNPTEDTALLTKNGSSKVRQVALYFYHEKAPGPSYSVTYLLR